MVNYIYSGDTVTLAAPYATASGTGALVGIAFGVATNDVASGAIGEYKTKGVFDLVKDTSTFAEGAVVYWDNTAKKCTSTSTSNTKIGVAVPSNADGSQNPGSASGDATVRVRLNGTF